MCLLRDYGLVTNRYKRFRLFLRIISAVGRAHDRLLFPVCLTPYNPLSFLPSICWPNCLCQVTDVQLNRTDIPVVKEGCDALMERCKTWPWRRFVNFREFSRLLFNLITLKHARKKKIYRIFSIAVTLLSRNSYHCSTYKIDNHAFFPEKNNK